MSEFARHPSIVRALSLGLLLLVWVAAASLTADASILPQPWALGEAFARAAGSGALPYHLAMTLGRVVMAFVPAMAIGVALGFLMGRYPAFDRWLDPWLVVFLNLPALVLIVLCYLWIGLNELAAIIAVTLNKTAMVMVTVRQGVKSFDPALDDLAFVARLSPRERLRHLILPQLAPWLAVAARNGIAVIWKIVLVVEFLGRSNGIGFRIHLYFQQFQTAHVIAYSLAFVGVMLIVEHMLIQPLETRSVRWKAAKN